MILLSDEFNPDFHSSNNSYHIRSRMKKSISNSDEIRIRIMQVRFRLHLGIYSHDNATIHTHAAWHGLMLAFSRRRYTTAAAAT